MRLSHLVLLLAVVGGLWYFDLIPFGRQQSPPSIVKADPSRIRSLQAVIRQNERIIGDLENQARRYRNGVGTDRAASSARNKRIAELRSENMKLQARIDSGGH